jgi:hypothetical protein
LIAVPTIDPLYLALVTFAAVAFALGVNVTRSVRGSRVRPVKSLSYVATTLVLGGFLVSTTFFGTASGSETIAYVALQAVAALLGYLYCRKALTFWTGRDQGVMLKGGAIIYVAYYGILIAHLAIDLAAEGLGAFTISSEVMEAFSAHDASSLIMVLKDCAVLGSCCTVLSRTPPMDAYVVPVLIFAKGLLLGRGLTIVAGYTSMTFKEGGRRRTREPGRPENVLEGLRYYRIENAPGCTGPPRELDCPPEAMSRPVAGGREATSLGTYLVLSISASSRFSALRLCATKPGLLIPSLVASSSEPIFRGMS